MTNLYAIGDRLCALQAPGAMAMMNALLSVHSNPKNVLHLAFSINKLWSLVADQASAVVRLWDKNLRRSFSPPGCRKQGRR